jgi:hypothetical protein
MMPHGPSSPEPICSRCSKPVTPGTASRYEGPPAHIRCLARAIQLEATEQQNRARETRKRADALVERASELSAQARARPWLCPVCTQLLSAGSLLYQGDVVVHATCWREPTRPTPDRTASQDHP